uniref:Uncharacterized protein n=1 Tax=Anopheles christyi TaxID=43041 RepID=A0A182JTR8_9DIPT
MDGAEYLDLDHSLDTYDPVPDFGLPVTVAGSAQVISITNQTSALLKTATNNFNDISLRSNYTKHQNVLKQLATIANFTANIDQSIVKPLFVLTTDSSGNVSDLFKTALEGIASTQRNITHTLLEELNGLEMLIDHYVPDRLKDGFGCVQSGLEKLNKTLEGLQSAIMNAIRNTGTVSMLSTVFKKFVSLKTVHDVVRSVRAMSVCIPSIIETINSTIARIKTADNFIHDMNKMVSKFKLRFG